MAQVIVWLVSLCLGNVNMPIHVVEKGKYIIYYVFIYLFLLTAAVLPYVLLM